MREEHINLFMYIPDDFKDRLLATVSIVEVIQKRRQIERRVVLIWPNAHFIKEAMKVMPP